MKLSPMSEYHRLAVAIGLGVALTVSLLIAVSPVRAEPPVPHDIVFLIDNSPSVRIGDTTGNGIPDITPDEQDMRLRLTRFVVNVFGSDPAGGNRRVGAIGFARSTQMLMPLTPVRDWSKADFAAVREIDQGSGTDFAAALDAASEMLFPPDAPDCSPDVRRCDIVVISDGFFDNIARDRPAAEAALRDLRSRGVSVHLLTFAAYYQDVWQELLTDTLISTYRPNVVLASPGRVYGTMLRDLGAEALLAGLTPVEVDGEQTIALTIPPFRTWTRYRILPDSPMTVTFLHAGRTVTPVVAGTEYTFFRPLAGEWHVRLQGSGLAYYRQVGEGVADLALYVRAPDESLAVGGEVAVRAGLTAGGAPVTDLTLFTVTATISGTAGVTGPLVLKPDERVGLFATTVPSAWFESGVYTVALAAESSVPGVEVEPVGRRFEMIALPTLAMTVTPTGPIRPGQSVYVTVTVGNWRPEYEVTMHLLHPNGMVSEIQPHTQSSGTYLVTLTSTDNTLQPSALVVQVFGEQRVPYDYVVHLVEPLSHPRVEMAMPVLSALTLILLMALTILVWRWWQRKREMEDIRRGFKEKPGAPELWRRWRRFSIENSWPIIEELGGRLAEDWRKMRQELNRKGNYRENALLAIFAQDEAKNWVELSSHLGEWDERALAVLIYGGIAASTELAWDWSQRDRRPLPNSISPFEALEGTDEGSDILRPERPSCIGESLGKATGQAIFLEVLNFVEGKYGKAIKQSQEKRKLSIWKRYSDLVRLCQKDDPDRRDVERARKALGYLKKRAANENLSTLLNDMMNDEKQCGSISELDTRPLLQIVCKKLRGGA